MNYEATVKSIKGHIKKTIIISIIILILVTTPLILALITNRELFKGYKRYISYGFAGFGVFVFLWNIICSILLSKSVKDKTISIKILKILNVVKFFSLSKHVFRALKEIEKLIKEIEVPNNEGITIKEY